MQRKPWLRRHPNRVFVFRAKMELALAVFVIAACSIEPAALWNGCEGADLARAGRVEAVEPEAVEPAATAR